MEGMTEKEMLEAVESMDDSSLREVLLDEGATTIPEGAAEMREALRMITYCNYQEYSVTDEDDGEVMSGFTLSELRQLLREGEISPAAKIWSEDMGSEWMPIGDFLAQLYGGADTAAAGPRSESSGAYDEACPPLGRTITRTKSILMEPGTGKLSKLLWQRKRAGDRLARCTKM
jgi:hypothetical protein